MTSDRYKHLPEPIKLEDTRTTHEPSPAVLEVEGPWQDIVWLLRTVGGPAL